MTSSRRWKVHHQQISCRFYHFFWTWCDKQCCQVRLRCSNRGQRFFLWGLFIRQAHCYQNQWNTALMEWAVMSIMQTPAITLWFPEQCLLGFFILEKQFASQNVFLIRSKLSITAYFFLVLYRSTSLQSLLFLKNIETFLFKYKLVNHCTRRPRWLNFEHDSSKMTSKIAPSEKFLPNLTESRHRIVLSLFQNSYYEFP